MEIDMNQEFQEPSYMSTSVAKKSYMSSTKSHTSQYLFFYIDHEFPVKTFYQIQW